MSFDETLCCLLLTVEMPVIQELSKAVTLISDQIDLESAEHSDLYAPGPSNATSDGCNRSDSESVTDNIVDQHTSSRRYE